VADRRTQGCVPNDLPITFALVLTFPFLLSPYPVGCISINPANPRLAATAHLKRTMRCVSVLPPLRFLILNLLLRLAFPLLPRNLPPLTASGTSTSSAVSTKTQRLRMYWRRRGCRNTLTRRLARALTSTRRERGWRVRVMTMRSGVRLFSFLPPLLSNSADFVLFLFLPLPSRAVWDVDPQKISDYPEGEDWAPTNIIPHNNQGAPSPSLLPFSFTDLNSLPS
jgi:hypothetical protein